MKAYVKARLATFVYSSLPAGNDTDSDFDSSLEWREVEADDLEQAIKIVEQQDDVEVVLEASLFPGGVVT